VEPDKMRPDTFKTPQVNAEAEALPYISPVSPLYLA